MFNATNPFNQAQDYDLNYQTWKHKQEYGYNQVTALSNNSFTPTPLRTEEERRNYMYNIGALQQMLKKLNNNRMTEKERIEAIRNNQSILLDIQDNPSANGNWPIYHSHSTGEWFVNKYNNIIEKYANKHGVDIDLIKAVMYTENATGHYGGINYLADELELSGSQAPMNIQGATWGTFNNQYFDTSNPEQNIELATILLKKISQSIKNPTVAKIGTLWNETGANYINDIGARIEHNYKNKFWDTTNLLPELTY